MRVLIAMAFIALAIPAAAQDQPVGQAPPTAPAAPAPGQGAPVSAPAPATQLAPPTTASPTPFAPYASPGTPLPGTQSITPAAPQFYSDSFVGVRADSPLDKTVTVNASSDPVADLLKQLLSAQQVDYRIDSNVQDTLKITIHAANVKLRTALDFVTESAGVKWRLEAGKDGKPLVHIGKDLAVIGALPVVALDYRSLTGPDMAPVGVTRTFGNTGSARSGDVQVQRVQSGQAGSTWNEVFQPYYETLTGTEERSTFICPHCHTQITILRKPVEPRCPKCGALFHSDWKFCPHDGTPRPPDPATWHYCPVCGKRIDTDAPGENPEDANSKFKR